MGHAIGQPQDQPTPHAYPTAPLPPAAREAADRLASHFPLIQATTRHETAAVHAAQLAARAQADGTLTDLDADDLAHAEDVKAAAHTLLADAGRLDLIGATR